MALNLGKPKVAVNSYYLNSDRHLIRILHINRKDNRVLYHDYDEKQNNHMEFDTAPHYLTPLYKIGDLAKMINRAPDTIRKYEREGIFPPPTKYSLGQREMRLYTSENVIDISIMLSQRRPVGRPSGMKKISKVNQKDLMDGLKRKFEG